MNKNKVWLSSPHMGGTERNYVQEAFDTNWIAPLGPNVTAFEQALQTYIGQDDIRGYSKGEYRGDQVYTAQVELRQNISNKFGMVGFLGAGVAVDQFSDISNMGDAETWVDHLGRVRNDVDRQVDYHTIEKMINRAEPLVNTYEELMQRPTDDAAKQAFLSIAVTLLKSLNQFITSDKVLVMALKEDDLAPFYNLYSR